MRGEGISAEEALAAVGRHSRDNARTPFQWSASPGAGFTAGTPWLRINPGYTKINLEQQMHDPASVFNYYKKLTALRKDPLFCETLIYGDFEPYLEDVSRVIAYLRRAAGQTILVLSNYCKETRSLPLPAPVKKVLLDNCAGSPLQITEKDVVLTGYRTLVMEMLNGGSLCYSFSTPAL